jgi:hypothetical protein
LNQFIFIRLNIYNHTNSPKIKGDDVKEEKKDDTIKKNKNEEINNNIIIDKTQYPPQQYHDDSYRVFFFDMNLWFYALVLFLIIGKIIYSRVESSLK